MGMGRTDPPPVEPRAKATRRALVVHEPLPPHCSALPVGQPPPRQGRRPARQVSQARRPPPRHSGTAWCVRLPSTGTGAGRAGRPLLTFPRSHLASSPVRPRTRLLLADRGRRGGRPRPGCPPASAAPGAGAAFSCLIECADPRGGRRASSIHLPPFLRPG
jgi:hypothetical protein